MAPVCRGMRLDQREGVAVVTHPLARETLTRLRDRETDRAEFRSGLVELGRLCGHEIVADRFDTEAVSVHTPLMETTGERVTGLSEVVVVSVLRAALPFVEGVLTVMPAARQGVVSASRDEDAGRDDAGRFPVSLEYVRLPRVHAAETVVVADPMLATGSTMVTVLDEVTAAGASPSNVVVLAAVAAPAGIDRVTARHPDVDVVTVAVDDRLDDNGFIVPGLGDAGDRAFGTP